MNAAITFFLFLMIVGTLTLVLINIYNPSLLGGGDKLELPEGTESLEEIVDKIGEVITAVNTLTGRVTTLENSVTELQNTPVTPPAGVTSSELEAVKEQIQGIMSTYVDKTKPIGLFSNSCDGKPCSGRTQAVDGWSGNAYRALTFNDKDDKGLRMGHSKAVATNNENPAFTQWRIQQEYPKPAPA